MPDSQPQIITPTQTSPEVTGEPPAAERPITVGYEPAPPAPVDPTPPAAPSAPPEPSKPSPVAITIQDENGLTLPAAAQQPAPPIPEPAAAAPVPRAPQASPLGITPPALDKQALQSKINNHPLFSGVKDKPLPKKRKTDKGLVWALVVLLVLIIGAYLAIDSGLVRGASHLPFHIFKQAKPVAQPIINTQQNTAKTPQPQTAAVTDPYAGWKTYSLTKEKLSFKYPSTWVLKDSTQTTDAGDSLSLTTADNFNVTITTGQSDFSLPAGGATVDQADAIQFAGQAGFLDLYEDGAQKTGSVSNISLSKSATDPSSFFATKTAAKSNNGNIKILMNYTDAKGNNISKPLATLEADTNYKDAKLLVESMSY